MQVVSLHAGGVTIGGGLSVTGSAYIPHLQVLL